MIRSEAGSSETPCFFRPFTSVVCDRHLLPIGRRREQCPDLAVQELDRTPAAQLFEHFPSCLCMSCIVAIDVFSQQSRHMYTIVPQAPFNAVEEIPFAIFECVERFSHIAVTSPETRTFSLLHYSAPKSRSGFGRSHVGLIGVFTLIQRNSGLVSSNDCFAPRNERKTRKTACHNCNFCACLSWLPYAPAPNEFNSLW